MTLNDELIPISIHTVKLQDWLISRRIVPKNFQQTLKDIRSKITNALEDMPSNEELIQLLRGTSINYYHCKQIVDILRQTEKDSRSIFGNYGSKRMKDWLEILRLYEKDNVYLGELAQLYVNNVNYEVVSIRKQMTTLEQRRDDCLKKYQKFNKQENSLLAEYNILLQQIGIKGNNLRKEFIDIVQTLPDLYDDSIMNIKFLKSGIDLYMEMGQFDVSQCLPITRHLIEFGNTTTYQYIHKEIPISIEEPPLQLQTATVEGGTDIETDSNDICIDFGGDESGGNTSSSISGELINADELNATDNSGDIDWGNMENVETNEEPVKITFDISLEEYGIVMEASGVDAGVAKGDQAYTILDSPKYRELFIDELYELSAFLQSRLLEVHREENTMAIISETVMDRNISKKNDEKFLENMSCNVESIIQLMFNEHTQHLFQLKHSPKYAQLLIAKLNKKLASVQKMQDQKEEMKNRADEIMQKRLNLNPILDNLIAQTKQMQQEIVDDISKRYKGRTVILLGATI